MYMYNVWLNWWPQNEYEPSILEYYEWRKSDGIEKVERIPVIYITKQLFSYLAQYDAILPKKIEKIISHRTYVFKEDERVTYPYACIIANEKQVLAIQWEKDKRLWKKSKLIPKQERYVQQNSQHIQKVRCPFSFSFMYKEQIMDKQKLGLTRREKEKRELLLTIFEQIKQTASNEELFYWQKEWYYEQNIAVTRKSCSQTIGTQLQQVLQSGWSIEHDRFFRKLYIYYMKVYEHQLSAPFISIEKDTKNVTWHKGLQIKCRYVSCNAFYFLRNKPIFFFVFRNVLFAI